MKRLELGLTDIERRQKDEQRRVRNCIKALLLITALSAIVNYATQISSF